MTFSLFGKILFKSFKIKNIMFQFIGIHGNLLMVRVETVIKLKEIGFVIQKEGIPFDVGLPLFGGNSLIPNIRETINDGSEITVINRWMPTTSLQGLDGVIWRFLNETEIAMVAKYNPIELIKTLISETKELGPSWGAGFIASDMSEQLNWGFRDIERDERDSLPKYIRTFV
jgi:hypothetical protein